MKSIALEAVETKPFVLKIKRVLVHIHFRTMNQQYEWPIADSDGIPVDISDGEDEDLPSEVEPTNENHSPEEPSETRGDIYADKTGDEAMLPVQSTSSICTINEQYLSSDDCAHKIQAGSISPALSSSTTLSPDDCDRTSDDVIWSLEIDDTESEDHETVEWADIPLSPAETDPHPEIGTLISNEESIRLRDYGSHLTVPELVQPNDERLVDLSQETSKQGEGNDAVETASLEDDENTETLDFEQRPSSEAFDWDIESLYSRWSSDSDSIEEENPRLARYERWQLETQYAEHSYQILEPVFPHRLATIMEESDDEQVDREVSNNPQILVSEYESPTSLEVNFDAEDFAEAESPQIPPGPPMFRTTSGMDITDAADIKTLANSLPASVVRNMSRDQVSVVQPRSSLGKPIAKRPVDDNAMSKVIENCIRYSSNLLCGNKSKAALARSHEIAKLMENMLMDNVESLTLRVGRRSLSDIIDGSAWRH